MTDLIERLRKSFRSLDGVVVVSPRLLEEAAARIEWFEAHPRVANDD